MHGKIKNIIFDFGDIFINLDKEAPLKGIHALDPEFVLDDLTRLTNEKYETGEIATPDFVAHYLKKLSYADESRLKDIWNSIILDLPEYRVEFLERLRSEHPYRLFLLSNTNALHMEQVVANTEASLFERFRRSFEQFYLSHEIGYRKPHTNIYEFVLEQNSLSPDETLFVDDLPENTRAAASLGIHTWNLTPGTEDVTDLFNKNLPL